MICSHYVSGGTGKVTNPDNEAVSEEMFTAPTLRSMKLLYYLTLPLRYMIYFTVPDVRKPESEHKPIISIVMSVIWLGLFSYILVESLNDLGNLFGINGNILGLTIGAWAASYPALWSSIVVAKHGFGDIASCNALGSNTFNNFVGLGLPWLTYSIVYGGNSYNSLQDGGVLASLFGLIFILIAYYILVALNDFTLKKWLVCFKIIILNVFKFNFLFLFQDDICFSWNLCRIY